MTNIRNFIASVRQSIKSDKRDSLTLQFVNNTELEIRKIERLLRNNSRQIPAEMIISQHETLRITLAKIKQSYENQKKEISKQWDEENANLQNFIATVRQSIETDEVDSLTLQFVSDTKSEVRKVERWLNTYSRQIPAEMIISQHETLKATLEEIKQSYENQKKENEKRWNDEYANLRNYIRSVRQTITGDQKDKLKSRFINAVNNECDKAEEWLQANSIDITIDMIISTRTELRLSIEKFKLEFKKSKTTKKEEEKRRHKAYDELNSYIQRVVDYVDSEIGKNYLSDQYFEKMKQKSLELKTWINTQYFDIDPEEIYSKTDRLKMDVKNILNDLNERKKTDETEKLSTIKKETAINNFTNCISDVETWRFFDPYTLKLTLSDKRKIEERCKYWNQWLSESSRNFSLDHIEAYHTEFEELAQMVLRRLRERQRIAGRKQRRKSLKEAAENLESYIEDVKQFLWSEKYKDLISENDKKWIYNACYQADVMVSNYQSYGLADIVSSHIELQESVSKLCDELNQKKMVQIETERRRRHDAKVKVYNYIKHVRSVLTPNRCNRKKVPQSLTYCEEAERWLHVYRATLSAEDIIEIYENISTYFENDCRKHHIKFQRTTGKKIFLKTMNTLNKTNRLRRFKSSLTK
uniref:probable myosin heavy chain ECU04_1000 n=1 Tax=Styela clava TaxID=7725 RepID=UPI00193A62C8|nr:probable myosin heavy chain ECU04_1000 [Styela clava]